MLLFIFLFRIYYEKFILDISLDILITSFSAHLLSITGVGKGRFAVVGMENHTIIK